MFKQLKAMRETTAALPSLIANAQSLRDAAQAYPQTAPAARGGSSLPAGDARLDPIAGIDLDSYARTVKLAVSSGRPVDAIAAELGLSADAWGEAATGWPARMNGDLALAVEYGTRYGSVA